MCQNLSGNRVNIWNARRKIIAHEVIKVAERATERAFWELSENHVRAFRNQIMALSYTGHFLN